MSTGLVFLVIVVQSVLGTFPPVQNPPPIPAQAIRAVRTLDVQPEQYYVQEDINQEPLPVPNVKDGPLPPENFNDQGWFVQERQISEPETSRETFDRYFQSGEPAIGPVATPMPDASFLSQPSNLAKVNPSEALSSGSPNIWIISRGEDNGQYASERWVQGPNTRVVEVVNQESVATDIDRSYSVPLPQVQAKSQIQSFPPGNVVQQILVRKNSPISSPKVVVNQPVVAEQILDPAPLNFKQVIQQQVGKDQFPAPPQVVSAPQAYKGEKSFVLPPPPAPPVKGDVTSPKVFSTAAVNPGPNVLITEKNGLIQQLRHIWVPTSTKTGRFVTIPASNSGKLVGKGSPLDGTPISVSDTWILKTDGLIPSFQQQKSLPPPQVVQSGKVVAQVDPQPVQQLLSVVDSLKNPSVVKNANSPVSIWPARNYVPNTKVIEKSIVESVPALQGQSPKSNIIVSGKSIAPQLPPVSQLKSAGKSTSFYPSQPQFNSPLFNIVNGKPCPIAPQNILANQKGSILVPPPISRFITTQTKQPMSRIIRVNRFPTGSYYLLNTQVRPNIITAPNPGTIQQSKTAIIQQQNKGLPLTFQPIQSNQPFIPAPKQYRIPIQQVISPKAPQRLVIYSLPLQQMKSPVLYPKSTGGLAYPPLQRYRYLNPLNGFPLNSPIQLIRPYFPLASPLKATKSKDSSSSSSESSSSEESSEEKKEATIEEKPEKEEKPKEAEEKESPGGLEKEGSEETKEESMEESQEAAESTLHAQVTRNSIHS